MIFWKTTILYWGEEGMAQGQSCWTGLMVKSPPLSYIFLRCRWTEIGIIPNILVALPCVYLWIGAHQSSPINQFGFNVLSGQSSLLRQRRALDIGTNRLYQLSQQWLTCIYPQVLVNNWLKWSADLSCSADIASENHSCAKIMRSAWCTFVSE